MAGLLLTKSTLISGVADILTGWWPFFCSFLWITIFMLARTCAFDALLGERT
jgi:hypothetical protein